ncbi:MAG: glycosyltransferase family 4 protein [Verrucomicrobia bacterium]|nr:glycosyltransferase family 4 protein [Verrucomicrobiota bacterium]
MKVSAGRVLMLVQNEFPFDTRVRNESALLAGEGYDVTVICLKRKSEKFAETVQGIRVYRLPRIEFFQKAPIGPEKLLQRLLMKFKAILGYVAEYAYFTLGCLILSLYVGIRHGFDVIHAHNPPDTLFLVALPFKLLGKKFVFDHHDLAPELYQSRYRTRGNIVLWGLLWSEKCSLKLADVTIATNESYKVIQIQRGGRRPEKCFVVRNGPGSDRMEVVAPSPRLRQMGKSILCYIGCLNPQDGLDYLLRALAHLTFDLKRNDYHCVIMGSGDSLEDLRKMNRELGLEKQVEFTGYISDAELRANLSAADICLDPDPSSPLNDVSTWIKIMEYMAYGKPIVSFDLKETRYSARGAAIYVEPNDERSFAAVIAQLMDDPELRQKMGSSGRSRVEGELQWSRVGQNLAAAYRALFRRPITHSNPTYEGGSSIEEIVSR